MKLFLYGYFGGRNFGDELMLLGLIADSKRRGYSEISIMTPDGELLPHLKEQVTHAYRRSPIGFLKGLLWADAFGICGGTVFHDAYPDVRHRSYRKNLLALSILLWIARSSGRSVSFFGVGMGPFHRPLTKFLTRIAVKAAVYVEVRDTQSFSDICELCGNRDKLIVGEDLGFSAMRKNTILEVVPENSPNVVVSIVPPSITSTVSTTEAAEFRNDFVRVLIAFLKRQKEWTVTVLVPASDTEYGDKKIAKEFALDLSEQIGERINLQPFTGDPTEFLSTLSKASLIIAMRFHIALASEILRKHVLWIPYQRKVQDAARAVEVPENRNFLPRIESIARIENALNEAAGETL